MEPEANALYRQLPAVGEVLESAPFRAFAEAHTQERVTAAVRTELGRLRTLVGSGALDGPGLEAALGTLEEQVGHRLAGQAQPRLRRVINASGVLLQTNLGRAPLSEAALARVVEVARGYCNLEFDLERGERGRRDDLVEALLLRVLAVGEEDEQAPRPALNGSKRVYGAAVVNNCAAATFLGLNTLAEGGEVVVSRGELVEIGGGFRIPEILRKAGATLREVGTTNKTRVGDYAAAIHTGTRLILRVHQSNFRIEGFTERPRPEELVALGQQTGVPVFDDQGTGCVVDLGELGIRDEETLRSSVRSGATLVAASGDKLMGGPQCGLLVGEREAIERIRANPLYRALRVDKLTYAALEATLLAYLTGEEAQVPVVAMLRTPAQALRSRCEHWASALCGDGIKAEVVPVRSVVGGGTAPGASVDSFAVSLRVDGMSEGAAAAALRAAEPAVVGRISDGAVLLDLRTVAAAEDEELIAVVSGALVPQGFGR